MRFSELEPKFEKIIVPNKEYHWVNDLESAQGVMFLCPRCFERNGGPVGTHYVLCWFKDRGVLDTEDPKPGRWAVQGTCFEDLTLVPSIQLLGEGCGWHGFITAGTVTTV